MRPPSQFARLTCYNPFLADGLVIILSENAAVFAALGEALEQRNRSMKSRALYTAATMLFIVTSPVQADLVALELPPPNPQVIPKHRHDGR